MNMTETAMAAEAEGEQVTRTKLMEDLKTVVADAEELLKATVGQTGERISAARVKAEGSLRAAKARLAVHEEALLAKSKAVAGAAENYVRANPWKGMGIAALAGLIIGILAARR
jgi:ElaB/YqjD/DUF883 family membrane-anchored ribosome-binding protein